MIKFIAHRTHSRTMLWYPCLWTLHWNSIVLATCWIKWTIKRLLVFFFNFGYKLIWGRTNEWRFLNSILLEKKKRLKSRSLERTDLVHFKGSFLHWNICAMGNVEAQRNLIFYLHIMSWLRRLSFTLLQCDPSISVNILCFLFFLLPSIIINRFRLYLSANGIVDWRI